MVPVSQLENCDSRNNPLKEGCEPISHNVDSYIDFDMFHFIVVGMHVSLYCCY